VRISFYHTFPIFLTLSLYDRVKYDLTKHDFMEDKHEDCELELSLWV
jgi:hypothetical protein